MVNNDAVSRCWNPAFEVQCGSNIYYVFAAINMFHLIRHDMESGVHPWNRANRRYSVFGDFDAVLELHCNESSLNEFRRDLRRFSPRVGVFTVDEVFRFSEEKWSTPQKEKVFAEIYYPEFHEQFASGLSDKMLDQLTELGCVRQREQASSYDESETTLTGFLIFQTYADQQRKQQIADEIERFFAEEVGKDSRLLTVVSGTASGDIQGDTLIEFVLPSRRMVSRLVVEEREHFPTDRITTRTYIVSSAIYESFASSFDLSLPLADTAVEYFLARLEGLRRLPVALHAQSYRVGDKLRKWMDYQSPSSHVGNKEDYPMRPYVDDFIVQYLTEGDTMSVIGKIKDAIYAKLKSRMEGVLKERKIRLEEVHQTLGLDTPWAGWPRDSFFEAATLFYPKLQERLLSDKSVELEPLLQQEVPGPIDYLDRVLFPILKDLLDNEPVS